MKPIAVLIIAMALLAGIVPHFTDCQSQGKAIELPNGKTLPMKCHWTTQAELTLAVPLALCGVFLGFRPANERRSELAMLTIVLGSFIALVPTVLIGVCAKSDMLCSAVMRPTLLVSGILAAGAGLFYLILDFRQGGSKP
jgi:hypothetical protein